MVVEALNAAAPREIANGKGMIVASVSRADGSDQEQAAPSAQAHPQSDSKLRQGRRTVAEMTPEELIWANFGGALRAALISQGIAILRGIGALVLGATDTSRRGRSFSEAVFLAALGIGFLATAVVALFIAQRPRK